MSEPPSPQKPVHSSRAMMAMEKSLSEKMGDWFRNVLSCCDQGEEEEERPALQISGPTNFRREDISIPGLDAESQRWIREKAISDASKMWEHLQPLRSSPSGQFASPENRLPTYEEFTTPRSALTPGPRASLTAERRTPGTRRISGASGGPSPLDRVRAHTRKISSSLSKPLGYHAVAMGKSDFGSPYEMRALMDQSKTGLTTQVVPPLPGKMSGESYSVAGSDLEDKDSGKGMMGRI